MYTQSLKLANKHFFQIQELMKIFKNLN